MAQGAAEISRHDVGTPVFAGMIAASGIGLFVIPMLYVTFQNYPRARSERMGRAPAGAAAAPPTPAWTGTAARWLGKPMFEKVLIANRGEIALRIHRACREMGIKTVAVHSTADADAMNVRLADETVCIGPPAARDSYLNAAAILSAATITARPTRSTRASASSPKTRISAAAVEEHGFAFIGPAPEHHPADGRQGRGEGGRHLARHPDGARLGRCGARPRRGRSRRRRDRLPGPDQGGRPAAASAA